MRVIALVNQRAGAVEAPSKEPTPDAIAAALEAAGLDVELRAVSGEQITDEARAAASQGADAVIAAGGDGTVSAAAGALAGGQTPLGVLPVGTLNHFAKDLGLPLDLSRAAQTIAAGHIERVDVGRVGDHIFINNSSLGVYARALIDRDARRDLHGLSKWPAMALAVLKVFKRRPLIKVRLNVDGHEVFRRTPLVFVGNNRYELDLLHVGKRAGLTGGELSLYLANTSSRWGMLKLALRGALGRLRQSRDFEYLTASQIRIEIPSRRRLRVALDGEVEAMQPPLDYQIWPRALPVIVPIDK